MPRTKTDYSRTVIYVIKCKDDNITEEYVGSTTDFIERKYSHKTACNNEKSKHYNYKIYKFIRENGGWNEWVMLEIEKYSCNDKREAEKREEEIRVERKAKLNSIKAFGAETRKEYIKQYYQENKEELKIRDKKYYEENKEEIKELNKKYREEHKEEIKLKDKKWYEENKDKIKEYNEENKDKIKEYKKLWGNKEFTCKCGWIGTNNSKRYHLTKCLPEPKAIISANLATSMIRSTNDLK